MESHRQRVFDTLKVRDWQSRTPWTTRTRTTRMILHFQETAGQPRNEILVVAVVAVAVVEMTTMMLPLTVACAFSFQAMRSRRSMMMMMMMMEEEEALLWWTLWTFLWTTLTTLTPRWVDDLRRFDIVADLPHSQTYSWNIPTLLSP
jgi:hypothetical protein